MHILHAACLLLFLLASLLFFFICWLSLTVDYCCFVSCSSLFYSSFFITVVVVLFSFSFSVAISTTLDFLAFSHFFQRSAYLIFMPSFFHDFVCLLNNDHEVSFHLRFM